MELEIEVQHVFIPLSGSGHLAFHVYYWMAIMSCS